MLTKLVNRIAAAVHTSLNRQPLRLAAKDIDIIVERVARIRENPLQQVSVTLDKGGHFDAEAARKLIAEHAGKGGSMEPLKTPEPAFHTGGYVGDPKTREVLLDNHVTALRLSPSMAEKWEHGSCMASVLEDAVAPGRPACDASKPPKLTNIPAYCEGTTDEVIKKLDLQWLHQAIHFEAALCRAVSLCSAGRMHPSSAAMYLRSEFHKVLGAQSRIARWCSVPGVAELKPAPVVDLERAARRAKKGLLERAEDMAQLLEQKPHACLPDRLPRVISRAMPLTGATFVLTGGLDAMSRDDAKARIEKLGGLLAGAVNRHPVILVRGTGIHTSSAKLQKAWYFNHPVISEERFLELLAEREAIQGDTDRIEQVCAPEQHEQALTRAARRGN